MTTLTQDDMTILEDFCDDYSCKLRKDYSGRGMYGEHCVGFVTDYANTDFAMYLAKWLIGKGHEELFETFADSRSASDSMGLSGIVYFPSVSAPTPTPKENALVE